MTILSEIKENINQHCEKTRVGGRFMFDQNNDLYPVFAPSQRDILELIDTYWVSKFLNNNFDSDGQKKPFLNVTKVPVFVAGRMLDIDTREVRVIPEGVSSPMYAHLFGVELSRWMKNSGFSKFLNNSKWRLPKYGTLIAKRLRDKDGVTVTSPSVKNIKSDASVENIKDSSFVTEEHNLSVPAFRDLAEKRGWNKVEEVVSSAKKGKVKLFEHYGKLSDKKNFHIVADDGDKGIVLEQDDIIDVPYKDVHWDKVDGRYLGIGQAENAFESQIHLNWVQYLKSRGLHWTSKHIYQTEDEGIDRNMLLDVDDGDVFHSRRPISPIPVEERNLHAYQEEESVWLSHNQRASFTQDVLMGTQKSGVPLGSTMIQAQMAGSFFENKREEFGDFIKEILNDWIIPSFKKKNSGEHLLNLTDANPEQMEKFLNLEVKTRTRERAGRHLSNRGTLPDNFALKTYESIERQRLSENPIKKIPKGAYSNLDYKIKLVITGEATDLRGKLQAIQVALQSTQDPKERTRLQNKLLQLIGEEPTNQAEEQSVVNVAEQKASQPRVRMPQGLPTRIQEQATS